MRTHQKSPRSPSRAARRAVAGVGVVALLGLSGCAQSSAPSPAAPQVTKTVTASPTSPTPDAVPTSPTSTATTSVTSPTSTATTPAPAPVLAAGATGDRVRELQARLRQIGWYSGAISATYDADTITGVKGFQTKRAVPPTGIVDTVTWTKLTAMTKMPTSDDMHDILKPGPALMQNGSTGTKVRELQARLKQIGWWSGDVTSTYGSVTTAQVKGFQAKRAIPVTGEVDQRTWDRLVAMTRQPTNDELNNVTPRPSPGGGSTAGLDSRCLTGRAMCISKSTRQLVWVVDGKALLRMDVRFGSENNPTREGAFTVYWKSRHHVSTIYHSAMPFAMFFSGGEAVHYSSDFAARGYEGASHGCVNVRNYNGIAWLFDQARVGDKVIVYW